VAKEEGGGRRRGRRCGVRAWEGEERAVVGSDKGNGRKGTGGTEREMEKNKEMGGGKRGEERRERGRGTWGGEERERRWGGVGRWGGGLRD